MADFPLFLVLLVFASFFTFWQLREKLAMPVRMNTVESEIVFTWAVMAPSSSSSKSMDVRRCAPVSVSTAFRFGRAQFIRFHEDTSLGKG